MNKEELDLIVAKAKETGWFRWTQLKQRHNISSGATPPPKVFNHFADWCEKYFNVHIYSNKVNNLRMIEAFLRAGKHMPTDVKNDNRRKADKLYDEILKESK